MTTDAQLESFNDPPRSSTTRTVLAAYRRARRGMTADEAYEFAYPHKTYNHANVDTFRVSVRQLRERGHLRDSGKKRRSKFTNRSQAVWVLGEDLGVVRAHKIKKLYKLADELKYDVIPRNGHA